jgi:hypothetical protein
MVAMIVKYLLRENPEIDLAGKRGPAPQVPKAVAGSILGS